MGVLKDLQLQGLNVGRGISSVQNEDKVKKKASYYILTAVSSSRFGRLHFSSCIS